MMMEKRSRFRSFDENLPLIKKRKIPNDASESSSSKLSKSSDVAMD